MKMLHSFPIPGHTFTKVVLVLVVLAFFQNIGMTQPASSSIHGKVTITAAPRAERAFRGSAYRRGGHSMHMEQKAASYSTTDVIVSAHPVGHMPEFPSPLPKTRMLQQDATFEPHVLPIMAGSTVEIINEDEIFHNVFSITPGAKFNIGRRPKGEVVERTIEATGPIQLFCDIHAQMNAVILSLDTPWFIRVSEDGTYTLDGLPAGSYEIRTYHPDLTEQVKTVTLTENMRESVDFTLGE